MWNKLDQENYQSYITDLSSLKNQLNKSNTRTERNWVTYALDDINRYIEIFDPSLSSYDRITKELETLKKLLKYQYRTKNI